jgi:hypothetical protein
VITRTIAFLIFLLGAAGTARATEVGSARTLGIGLAVGGPTSISGKYYLGPHHALDAGIAFWRWGRDRCGDPWDRRYPCDRYRSDRYRSLGLNADFLWQENLARGAAKLDWHIGAGARLWFWDDHYYDDVAVAARMPLGLDLMFSRPSFLEVFLEIAPALYIAPGTDLRFEGFVGVRFYL